MLDVGVGEDVFGQLDGLKEAPHGRLRLQKFCIWEGVMHSSMPCIRVNAVALALQAQRQSL